MRRRAGGRGASRWTLSHLHRRGPTCWKLTKGDVPQHCKVCRLGFFHEYETAVYAHPGRKHPASSFVWRRLRAGKDLILPDGARVGYGAPPEGEWNPPGERLVLDDVPPGGYGPWPHRCNRYGRAGRVDVVRYHPYHGSTNPVGQVCLRCNLDVQCLDRVVLGLPGDDGVGGALAARDLVPPPPPEGGAPVENVGEAVETRDGAGVGAMDCDAGTGAGLASAAPAPSSGSPAAVEACEGLARSAAGGAPRLPVGRLLGGGVGRDGRSRRGR